MSFWQPTWVTGDGMMELSGTMYLWIKALHIISVIAWMAGLLYLPRLYVYHANAVPGSELSETLKVMERRLLRAIMTPAMIASFVFGGWMLSGYGAPGGWPVWLWAKLVLVGAMVMNHVMQAMWRKDFAADQNRRSHKFYRVMNEVPTLAMIVLVIVVVVKPF